ncbi:Fur family transcriptional regulator [Cupriavidus necator]
MTMRYLKSLLVRFDVPASDARLFVLTILSHHAERHLSAQQLCAAMIKSERCVGISTFQTAIYDLTHAGVLTRVMVPISKNRAQPWYELADQPQHRHLYCIGCHKLIEIHDETSERHILQQLARAGLKPAGFDVARRGTCQACTPSLQPG